MATITLPTDNRFGALGQGIGGVLGQVLGAVAQKQTDTGVAQVIQDASVPPPQKLSVIMQKFGAPGVQSYTKQLQANLLTAQIAGTQAQTEGRQAATTGQTQSNEIQAATMPAAILAPALANTARQAQTALTGAQTAATQQQTSEAGQLFPLKTEALATATGETAARRDLTQTQADVLATQAKAEANLLQNPASIDDMLKEQGITDPQEAAYVKQSFALEGVKGFRAAVSQLQANRARVDAAKAAADIKNQEPQPTPEAPAKVADSAAQTFASTDNFMKALVADGGNSGTLSGATIKSFAAKHGFPVDDPTFLSEFENQQQAILARATSGNGFVSEGRIKLAQDVGMNLSKESLLNVMAANATADQVLASLNAQKARYSTTPNINMKPLDDEIAKWNDFKRRYDVSSYVTKDNKSVVQMGGAMVDPSTLKTIIDPTKTYATTAGKFTGAQIMQNAAAHGIDPRLYIQQAP